MSSARRRDSMENFIAIGIDFGTTYSGVCYALSSRPDTIIPIQGYPDSHLGGYNDPVQVPTVIDLASDRWGYQVAPSMDQIKWFKLLLLKEEDIGREEIRHSVYLKDARKKLERRKREWGETAVDIVARFLGKIWRHALSQIENKVTVAGLPLRVAITVPAIWPPYAEKAMKQAAEMAGILEDRPIGKTTLELVQEPEAAGLSILLERRDSTEIKEGHSFVVCDAGGGTVDVISYLIDSIRPHYQVRECVKGDGRLAGATLIDEAFADYLHSKTNLKVNELDKDEYRVFMARWEMNPKRQFNGRPEQKRFTLEAPVKAFNTWARVRGRTEFSISSEDMALFFQESYQGIRSLINEQVRQVERATGNKPKHIFLVGGLGDSPYIIQRLRAFYQNEITVLGPHTRWSAVAHGAVMRLLRDGIVAQPKLEQEYQSALYNIPEVTARKSRYSYGVIARHKVRGLPDFDPRYDKEERDAEGERVTHRINWYLFKGTEVVRRSPVDFHYTKDIKGKPPSKCVFEIQYSDADQPPIRPNDQVYKLCRIECDWDKPFHEWRRVGDPRDGWRRYDDLALSMKFEGGQPKWNLKVGTNQVRREVDVNYMD